MPLESMVQEVQAGIRQAMATDAWKEAEALGAGSDDDEDEGGAGGGGGGGVGVQQERPVAPAAAAAVVRRLKREHPEGQQGGAGGSVSMPLQQQHGEECWACWLEACHAACDNATLCYTCDAYCAHLSTRDCVSVTFS